jgi:putative ABC transport system permease protein
MSAFMQDIRNAFRSLSRAPAFTVMTGLILVIGMGGATAMVAVIYGVLLRPLPVHQQDRIVVAWKELRSSGYAHYPFGHDYLDVVANESRLFDRVAGVSKHAVSRVSIVDAGVTTDVNEAEVTGAFFEVLGVKAVIGRTFVRADDVDGAEDVVVISRGLWQRRYSDATDIVGRRVSIGGRRFAIVGVIPRDLDYPTGADIWRLTRSFDGPFRDAVRSEVDLIGRLKPGVTIDQAASELSALTRRQEETASAGALRGLSPVVRSFEQAVVGDVRPALTALFAAVALVLLIASANAANLFLMRNEARRQEFAVRLALGARRTRIGAQVMAEIVLLTVAAGAVGLMLTWGLLHPLITVVPYGIPRVESIRVDAAVVLSTFAIALTTAAVTGLAPVFSLGADVLSHVTRSGRGVAGTRGSYMRRAFVVGQVAIAVTVIAAAGLLTRTLLRLQAVETGIAAERLVLVELETKTAGDQVRHAAFLHNVITQLQSVPSIAAVTAVNGAPFSVAGWDVPAFTTEGQTAEQAATNPALNLEAIFPNYFETLRVPLVRGRAFTDADRRDGAEVVIISEDVAARMWPNENPIGKRLKMGGARSTGKWRTVVGVAASTRYRELTKVHPTLYLPAAQFLMTAQMLAVRTTAPLAAVASVTRERVKAIDSDVQVLRAVPFRELVYERLAQPRFSAFLLSAFGGVAMLLATVGLYAVMATHVRQRSRDIAVRSALGATALHLRRLILGEALVLAGAGAVVGIAGAVAATQLFYAMLYEVDRLDPVSLGGAALLLIATSALAAYLPARRAARIDPLIALRYE